jgi:hypothetical protein
MAKKSTVASFVEGKNGKHTPKPKSLTPKTSSTKAGDKKRDGKFAKPVAY